MTLLGWSCGLTSQSSLRRLLPNGRESSAVGQQFMMSELTTLRRAAGVGVQDAGGNVSSTASVRIEAKPALMASLEATFTARGTHIFPSNCKIPQAQLSAAVAEVPESLSPMVSVIPGQLLAMYLAERRRGGNLDQPRRLAKVTRTK